eukprot:683734-Rhodomonas_salina.1
MTTLGTIAAASSRVTLPLTAAHARVSGAHAWVSGAHAWVSGAHARVSGAHAWVQHRLWQWRTSRRREVQHRLWQYRTSRRREVARVPDSDSEIEGLHNVQAGERGGG